MLHEMSLFDVNYYTSHFQPFVEPQHTVHLYFLPVEYAIAIPSALLVLAISTISLFIGFVLFQEAGKNKKK